MDFDAVFFKGASLESSTSATAVDALLTPTTAHSAPLFSQVQRMDLEKRLRDDFFTQPANMAGLPAISVIFMFNIRNFL
jgi:Asp-tRNA(Asn)/Glu-tRNA(Gln) amidotransferase A subunit family amidase